MRIDSMDAASKIIEHSAEKSLSVNTSQKTVTAYPNEKTSREDSNALPASEKMIINTIEKANKVMTVASRSLEFSVHEKTKEIMVKVINTETKEVIREIPSEKFWI